VAETRRGQPPRQRREEVRRLDLRLRDVLLRETWDSMRCGMTGGYVGGRQAEAEFVTVLEETEGAGEQADGLAGPPLAAVRGVAAASAAPETCDQSGR
jgi:hypothetical protein